MTKKREEFVAHYVMYLDDFFLENSIESVYPHVDKIIIARTFKPWNGPHADLSETEKTLRKVLDQYRDKIEIYGAEFPDEQTQRNWLINFSKARGHKGAFIIDCDEIFIGNAFEKIYAFISSNKPKALRIPHHTFVKDASFCIAPPFEDKLFYIDLFCNPQFLWARSINLEQTFMHFDDPQILHFSYVRKKDEDILKKISSFMHSKDADWGQWYNDIYLNFNPKIQNFHPVNPEVWRKVQLFDPRKFPQKLMSKLLENKNLFYNQFIKDKKLIRLHLGSGSNILNGYINIDLYNQSADIKLDITDLTYFEDDSVEEIFLNAVFEHLYTFEQNRALKEWYRILKPGGLIRIDSLPDFDEIIKAYINKTKGHIKETFDLYEVTRYTHGDYSYDNRIGQMHKDLFTKEKIKSFLENAGFVIRRIQNVCWGNEPNPVNIDILATKGSTGELAIKHNVEVLYKGSPASKNATIANTTICCIDCYNYELSINALGRCLEECSFDRAVLLTDKKSLVSDCFLHKTI
jgi:predicted SAM-dependent methyltransferase